MHSSFLKNLLITVALLGASTAACALMSHFSIDTQNISILYVMTVVIVARFTSGYFWGIAASVAGVFGTNYFFTYPYHSLDFTLAGYPVAFLVMLIASLVTSTLTTRIKEQARLSAQRERYMENLYEFNRRLLAARGTQKIVNLTLEYLYKFTQRTVVFYTQDPLEGGTGVMRSIESRHESMLDARDEKDVVHTAFAGRRRAGKGTDLSPNANALYLPVTIQDHIVGVVGIFYEKEEQPQENKLAILDMLTSQAAMALEQLRLSDEQQAITLEAEKEKMRTNLLRSVSHDLRTPLTSIIGASSAILENGERLTPETSVNLMRDIHEEAEWLIRLVENLLTITRISGGPAKIKKQPEAVEEIVAESVARVKKRFPDVKLHVCVPDEFLMVPMDATLIEQVIINLLENAIRHSGTDRPINFHVTIRDDWAVFDVIDQGKGLAPEDIPHIFDGYPAEKRRSVDSSKGAGIGLSICKTIVSAHNGKMNAANQPGGGAVFTFMLPIEGGVVHEQ